MPDIRYFEGGWSGCIRDGLAKGPAGECSGLKRVVVDEIMNGNPPHYFGFVCVMFDMLLSRPLVTCF